MAKIIHRWLDDFIADEISAALSWKRSQLAGIKTDPEDARFSDDGSNLKSAVTLSSPEWKGKVQLLEVCLTGARSTGMTC